MRGLLSSDEAIKRERHPIPTIDELLANMAGAVKFSKVDLKAGYHTGGPGSGGVICHNARL